MTRWTGNQTRLRIEASEESMRSVILWAVGVPLPLILLLAFCTHHF
jgi:hypothetical protein